MPGTVRPAEPADAPAIARIYSEGIEERIATFETEPRRAADLAPWFAPELRLPLLVVEDGSEVVAWTRLSPYSERAA